MQSNELYDLMIRKGYPAGFASIVAEQMHTEYTSERMIRYISRCPLLPPQEVADEMLAILADRDGLVRKHISQHAQSKVNEMYRSGIFEDALEYTIREIRAAEYGLLRDFLYEAIFVPEGCEAPERPGHRHRPDAAHDVSSLRIRLHPRLPLCPEEQPCRQALPQARLHDS